MNKYSLLLQKGASRLQGYAAMSFNRMGLPVRDLHTSSPIAFHQYLPSGNTRCFGNTCSQRRYFSDNQAGGRNYNRRKGGNPFKVLGIAESTNYSVAKATFIKIAMENHPDTSAVKDVAKRDKMRDRFIAARFAFEQMVSGPDGEILLKEEAERMGEHFDAWFKQETGKDVPFSIDLDPQTIKEVAKYTEEHGSTGLDRDGGMWTLANMVTNAAKNSKDSQSILRLDSGELKRPNDQVDGVLRRKRRNR